MIIRKQHIIFFTYIVLYRLLVDFCYEYIVSDVFYYWNFRRDSTLGSMSVSWLFLLTLSPLIIKTFQARGFSGAVVSMFILVSLVPTTTLIGFSSFYDGKFVLLIYIYWLILLMANISINVIKLPLNNSRDYFVASSILLSVCLSVVYVSFRYTGFRFQFSLIDVYQFRAEAREFEVGLLLGYLVSAADNLLPVILVYCLTIKRYFIASILSAVIFINYGISSTKQVIFLLMLAYFFSIFFKSREPKNYYIAGFSMLLIFSIIEWWFIGTWFLTDVFSFRLMFIPSSLHYAYFDFFSNNELDLYRQSALRVFFDSPYKDNIQFLMGERLIGDFSARANNGLFTEAYYNLGVAGVIFIPIIIVGILKFLEGALRGLDHRVGAIFAVAATFVFMSVPFPTALLSTGMLAIFLVLSFLPRNQVNVVNLEQNNN